MALISLENAGRWISFSDRPSLWCLGVAPYSYSGVLAIGSHWANLRGTSVFDSRQGRLYTDVRGPHLTEVLAPRAAAASLTTPMSMQRESASLLSGHKADSVPEYELYRAYCCRTLRFDKEAMNFLNCYIQAFDETTIAFLLSSFRSSSDIERV